MWGMINIKWICVIPNSRSPKCCDRLMVNKNFVVCHLMKRSLICTTKAGSTFLSSCSQDVLNSAPSSPLLL